MVYRHATHSLDGEYTEWGDWGIKVAMTSVK